jgi:hypothetical protein
MLPADKVDREMAYLQIAIDKTAGDDERTAWAWILDAVAQYRARAGAQWDLSKPSGRASS